MDQQQLETALRRATDYLLTTVFSVIAVFFVAMAVASLFRDHDSTDNGDSRSGLVPYVDNLTGCHYLSSERGGLVPRMDDSGHQICTGQGD